MGSGGQFRFADNAGMIWIEMSDAGLDQFNPATRAEHDPGSISV